MGKSIEDYYQDSLNRSSLLDTFGIRIDDEEEEFMTSKEIVEQKKRLESQFGVSRPGQGNRGGDPTKIEEEVHFKRYTTRREHKYTEAEMQQIRDSCMSTIVHDYGERDIYHMSDEERAENDMLAELRPKLGALKRTYRKVDQYVEAMRTVMEAWRILEKNNYLHSRDEFYDLIAKGRIYSRSIIMPKLKKMDNYNIDLLIQYISNPDADASKLAPIVPEVKDPFYDVITREDDPWYDYFYNQELERINAEEDNKDEDEQMSAYDRNLKAHQYATKEFQRMTMERYLDPEEVELIRDHMDNPPDLEVQNLKRKYYKNYDKRTFTLKKRKKKDKNNKNERFIIENTHRILNKIQMNAAYNGASDFSRSYLITQSMFGHDKKLKDFWAGKEFHGSWANKDDVLLYDLAIREALLQEKPEGQRYYSYADQELSQFFKALEDHGINTLDLRRRMNLNGADSSVHDDISKAGRRKENKKMEAAILQRISKLNNDSKFKKLISKAEKDLNKRFEEGN